MKPDYKNWMPKGMILGVQTVRYYKWNVHEQMGVSMDGPERLRNSYGKKIGQTLVGEGGATLSGGFIRFL